MKKTSNKGFSMVELIIVIAIMAILAAALAPALIKYINKSRLSTDIQTGTTIASAATAALAVEKANDDAAAFEGQIIAVNGILSQAGGTNEFANEFAAVVGMDSVTGKSKKDIEGTNFPNAGTFYISINSSKNAIQVWYGTTDDDHLVSPTPGASMAE